VAVSPLKQRISRYRKAHLDAGMIGGEGVDRWYNINTYDTNLVNDSLWLGGVLLRDTTKPLEIWHRGYDTNDDAKIMFIDKNGAEIFIFGVIPTTELTYRNLTAENIDNLAHGDTVYFKFYFQHENGNWWYTKGRYTGPNRLASDNLGWTAHDKYCSPEFRNTNLKFQTFPPYRRWFVADYLKDSDGYTTDTVELGVENFSFLDDDYDDLVFRVRGVCVNTMLTKIPESPARRSWRRSYGEND
jgi:hypothetical protein